MGGLILSVDTLYRLFCLFKLFLMVGKGLKDTPENKDTSVFWTLCYVPNTLFQCKFTRYEDTSLYRTLHQDPKVSTLEGFLK